MAENFCWGYILSRFLRIEALKAFHSEFFVGYNKIHGKIPLIMKMSLGLGLGLEFGLLGLMLGIYFYRFSKEIYGNSFSFLFVNPSKLYGENPFANEGECCISVRDTWHPD